MSCMDRDDQRAAADIRIARRSTWTAEVRSQCCMAHSWPLLNDPLPPTELCVVGTTGTTPQAARRKTIRTRKHASSAPCRSFRRAVESVHHPSFSLTSCLLASAPSRCRRALKHFALIHRNQVSILLLKSCVTNYDRRMPGLCNLSAHTAPRIGPSLPRCDIATQLPSRVTTEAMIPVLHTSSRKLGDATHRLPGRVRLSEF